MCFEVAVAVNYRYELLGRTHPAQLFCVFFQMYSGGFMFYVFILRFLPPLMNYLRDHHEPVFTNFLLIRPVFRLSTNGPGPAHWDCKI